MEAQERNYLTQLLTVLRILKLRGRTYVNIQTLAENMRLSEETIFNILSEIRLGIPDNFEFEIGQSLDLLETLLGHHCLT